MHRCANHAAAWGCDRTGCMSSGRGKSAPGDAISPGADDACGTAAAGAAAAGGTLPSALGATAADESALGEAGARVGKRSVTLPATEIPSQRHAVSRHSHARQPRPSETHLPSRTCRGDISTRQCRRGPPPSQPSCALRPGQRGRTGTCEARPPRNRWCYLRKHRAWFTETHRAASAQGALDAVLPWRVGRQRNFVLLQCVAQAARLSLRPSLRLARVRHGDFLRSLARPLRT